MIKGLRTFKKNIRLASLLWKNFIVEIKDTPIAFFRYGIIGNSISIEASTICQLKCTECFQTKGRLGAIGRGYLKFHDFKKFVDRYSNFKNIELSNSGEIFLNPEIKEIIRYAFIKNVNLTAFNGVNLNTVSDEIIHSLVKYQFKLITVAIDGASNHTYRIYRRGGNFDRVIANIKKINHYKKRYNSEFPKLLWQFVIFGHNEHELPVARKMARELNMQFKPEVNRSQSYSPVENIELARKESGLGAVTRKEYEQITGKHSIGACGQLWVKPQINWDGKLFGCCYNRAIDYGNVFKLGLKKCIKSKKYIHVKNMLIGKEKLERDMPCFYCNRYKNIQHIKLLRKIQTLSTMRIPLRQLEAIFLFGLLVRMLKRVIVGSIKLIIP